MVLVLSAGLGPESSRAADSILESRLTKTQKASFFKAKFLKKKKHQKLAIGPPGLQMMFAIFFTFYDLRFGH